MITRIPRIRIPTAILKKTRSYLWEHRLEVIRMAVLTASVVLPHAVSYANDISTNMPWDKGVNTLQRAMTGPLPRAGSAISIASAAAMWMFGESRMSQVGMRIALGSGVALGAPSAATALSGVQVDGCLF